jgi:hypothetical protein
MTYAHLLDPDEYLGKTHHVLKMMLADDYPERNIADVNIAFEGLYNRHHSVASKSPDGLKDAQCSEILKTIHIMAGLWADLWQQRGEEVFNEKLNQYFRKAQQGYAAAHDELLYQALLTKAPNPDIIDRDYERRVMRSRKNPR